jgi:fructose-1,6-bisphosphatase I
MHILETLDSDLSKIIIAILNSSIQIQKLIREIPLHSHLQGEVNSQNFSGDIQKKLDVFSNDIMIKKLIKTNCCSFLLSEENENVIEVKQGDYMVAFDPLDGSSNIDCNVCIGTIFSIYKKDNSLNFLKSGRDIEVAGYILYGPATEAVIACNNKVHRFALNPFSKSYCFVGYLSLENKNKKIYSINEANSLKWNKDIANYIQLFKESKYTQRYIGSMVADVHRTLLYGGMFCYPADEDNKKGKLRLVYECFPMAFIFELAGGEAIVGNFSDKKILDVFPKQIHERTPILLGSKNEIAKYFKVLYDLENENNYLCCHDD